MLTWKEVLYNNSVDFWLHYCNHAFAVLHWGMNWSHILMKKFNPDRFDISIEDEDLHKLNICKTKEQIQNRNAVLPSGGVINGTSCSGLPAGWTMKDLCSGLENWCVIKFRLKWSIVLCPCVSSAVYVSSIPRWAQRLSQNTQSGIFTLTFCFRELGFYSVR